MVRVKCNEHGKCFHIAAPDLGIVEHSPASSSPFPSSAPSFGFNTNNPFTAESSSSFGSSQPLGFAKFATPNAPSFGSIASPSFGSSQPLGFARFAKPNAPSFGSPSFGTSFPNTKFPWSSNTSSSANINSSVQNPSNAATFEFPVNGNSPSAFSGDNANIANTNPTTRLCSSAPLFGFGPAIAQPENTKFLAPQETPYPFQVSPFAQFPWSNNTSSAAANNNTCILSSHGNAKNRSCACTGRLNNPSSGNNINSSVQNPLNAATFELPINGNSLSAFSGNHATIGNTTTTRSCSCDGKLNPPSENNLSSTTPSLSSPLFGPASVPSETTTFLAPQETPNPFQFHPFSQFPCTALPFYAAIPSNKYYNGFTSLYGVPSSSNSKYPYGLPQHILLMALSPVPTTPLFSLPYSPYATPYDNQLKHCTCCCKCNEANDDPEPKHGFPGDNIGKANPPGSGSGNTIPSEFKYTETVVEGGEKFMSISAMPAVGNRSVEELRWKNCQSQSTATRDGNGTGGKKNVTFG